VRVATKTSMTHPLRVDWLDPALLPAGAALGLTFAPGKVDAHARSGPWARELDADLDRLARVFAATTVVSIVEAHEFERLRIPGLGAGIGQRGMHWIHVEVVDGGIPDAQRQPAWRAALRQVHARLRAGERVVVHCMGGLGRTGTFAAALLASFGLAPDEAIAACRRTRPGTVENQRQAEYVAAAARWWAEDLDDRYRGCLLGGAIGDALGAAVEFQSLAELRRRHGQAGVRELLPAYGGVGRFTDDTQMTLFTAEGLLRALAKPEPEPIVEVERALWRWLWTQGDPVPAALREHADGSLYATPALHAARAPGNTCLSALRARVRAAAERRPLAQPLNDSKGCGGVMRVAPAGMLGDRGSDRLGDPWTLACACARLTHEHPAGWDSAGLFAEIIAELLGGWTLAAASDRVWTRRRALCHPDTQRAIDAALTLARSGTLPSADQVESLGGGWVGEEALAIALYCALVSDTVEDALALAVTHSGDSDSTGAIAGNLLGAEQGLAGFPDRWLAPLELADQITQIARELRVHSRPR
jgi:ADP-ribosyl-[dinitrogen reductase] hydrolase